MAAGSARFLSSPPVAAVTMTTAGAGEEEGGAAGGRRPDRHPPPARPRGRNGRLTRPRKAAVAIAEGEGGKGERHRTCRRRPEMGVNATAQWSTKVVAHRRGARIVSVVAWWA